MDKPEHVSVVLARVFDRMIADIDGQEGAKELAGDAFCTKGDATVRVYEKTNTAQSEAFQQPVPWDRDCLSALREFRRVDDGMAYGVERTDAIRNGQVPLVAAAAFALLAGDLI